MSEWSGWNEWSGWQYTTSGWNVWSKEDSAPARMGLSHTSPRIVEVEEHCRWEVVMDHLTSAPHELAQIYHSLPEGQKYHNLAPEGQRYHN